MIEIIEETDEYIIQKVYKLGNKIFTQHLQINYDYLDDLDPPQYQAGCCAGHKGPIGEPGIKDSFNNFDNLP